MINLNEGSVKEKVDLKLCSLPGLDKMFLNNRRQPTINLQIFEFIHYIVTDVPSVTHCNKSIQCNKLLIVFYLYLPLWSC